MLKQLALAGLLALTLSTCQTATNTQSATKPVPTVKQEAYTVSERIIALPDGQSLYGKLYLPNNAQGKLPLVIYSHGLGGTHTNLEKFAQALARQGVAGYVFDFRGGGRKSQSSGSTTQMTVLTEVSDLENVLNQARQWDFVDSQKKSL